MSNNIIDIHSTGGVGDNATLALIPILVAAGIPTIKLLGRGLGNSGGTIDKLESIPGFSTNIAIPDMIKQLRDSKFAISSQIQNIVPANKTLQVLRYATSTNASIPLIASSVVAKKIATGTNNIIIDIKYGSGAAIKNIEDAHKLSDLIIKTGKAFGKTITTLVNSMDEPLGRADRKSVV